MTLSKKIISIATIPLTVLFLAGPMGCADDGGGDGDTVTVDALEPGDGCPGGGYRITVGTDGNDDGLFEGEEITQSYVVCDGVVGEAGLPGVATGTLAAVTDLIAGDADCPYGGARIDLGLDDGEGDGTAGDGILQPGEIDSTSYACDGRSDVVVEPYDPPAGPAGAYTINTSGGNGTDLFGGTGGNAGWLNVELAPGSIGGHVKLFNTGQADAGYPVPAVTSYLGPDPAQVTVDTTVSVQSATLSSHAGLANGHLHTHDGDFGLWIYDDTATDNHRLATGLSVGAGATVLFEINHTVPDPDQAKIALVNDLHNSGTLTTERLADGRSAAGLYISCDSYFGDQGSAVDLSGDDGSGTAGGNGGLLYLDIGDDDVNATAGSGSVINRGAIDTTGGAGTAGGQGGNVDFDSILLVYNDGAVNASGGAGSAAAGGLGGRIYFATEYGDLANAGALTANGGNGATAGGDTYGPGDPIQLYVGYTGNIFNNGPIVTTGGRGDGTFGGKGGNVYLYAYGGAITNGADITTSGGSGANGDGGKGGDIYIENTAYTGWAGSNVPPGDITLSGNFDTRGGLGDSPSIARTGGFGGNVEIYLKATEAPNNQEIILYGYTQFTANGGQGSNGGAAGSPILKNEGAEVEGIHFPSGGVFNYINVEANGGVGADGPGGSGGKFEIYTDLVYGHRTEGELAHNHGNLTLNGGNGTSAGGGAGYILIVGNNGVQNHGNVSAVGGSASSNAAAGGSANSAGFMLHAEQGEVVNTGSINISGGLSTGPFGTGGHGGIIEMFGTSVATSGDLTSAGGDSAGTASTTGGNGEGILLYGIDEGTTAGGTFNVAGGTGETAGTSGNVFIDGMNQTAAHL